MAKRNLQPVPDNSGNRPAVDEFLIIDYVRRPAEEELREVYKSVPADVVQQCEFHRIGITGASVGHLVAVHDLLAPYKRFKEWCEMSGIGYRGAVSAVARFQGGHKMLARPTGKKSPHLTWNMRVILFNESFDALFNGELERWIAMHDWESDPFSAEEFFARCERLAHLLLDLPRAVEAEAEHLA